MCMALFSTSGDHGGSSPGWIQKLDFWSFFGFFFAQDSVVFSYPAAAANAGTKDTWVSRAHCGYSVLHLFDPLSEAEHGFLFWQYLISCSLACSICVEQKAAREGKMPRLSCHFTRLIKLVEPKQTGASLNID